MLMVGCASWVSYPPSPVAFDGVEVLPSSERRHGSQEVSVQFFGTSTLTFFDGSNRWMTDGWFARHTPFQTLFTTLTPNEGQIQDALERLDLDPNDIQAIIPLHAHFDHAMDAPVVAAHTGARLYGDRSIGRLAQAYNAQQIRNSDTPTATATFCDISDKRLIEVGDFRIHFLDTNHIPFPCPIEAAIGEGTTVEPRDQLAGKVWDFEMGTSWTLYVDHPAHQFIVTGTAGLMSGLDAYSDKNIDTLFLSIGAIGRQDDDYLKEFWRSTVETVWPKRVVFIHWDSFTGSTQEPFTGMASILGYSIGQESKASAFLRKKVAGLSHCMEFATLPRIDNVVLTRPEGRNTCVDARP